MDEFGYFLAAYIVVWIVIFGYVSRISRIQNGLRREIDSMKQELKFKSNKES